MDHLLKVSSQSPDTVSWYHRPKKTCCTSYFRADDSSLLDELQNFSQYLIAYTFYSSQFAARCMEDLLSTTRYVSWSLHNKVIMLYLRDSELYGFVCCLSSLSYCALQMI